MSEGFPGLPVSDGMPRELRHLHGTVLHEHDDGHIPHNHGPAPRRPVRLTVPVVIFIIVLVLGGLHEMSVLMSRGNPPVSCQLAGGQWNVLTGWHCG